MNIEKEIIEISKQLTDFISLRKLQGEVKYLIAGGSCRDHLCGLEAVNDIDIFVSGADEDLRYLMADELKRDWKNYPSKLRNIDTYIGEKTKEPFDVMESVRVKEIGIDLRGIPDQQHTRIQIISTEKDLNDPLKFVETFYANIVEAWFDVTDQKIVGSDAFNLFPAKGILIKNENKAEIKINHFLSRLPYENKELFAKYEYNLKNAKTIGAKAFEKFNKIPNKPSMSPRQL